MKDKIAEVSAAIGIAVVAQNLTHAGGQKFKSSSGHSLLSLTY
jgi:hypothetical protein